MDTFNYIEAMRRTIGPEEAAKLAPNILSSKAVTLTAKPTIKKALFNLLKRREEELQIAAGLTLETLKNIAFFDPAELLDENNQLLPLSEMSPAARKAITDISIGKNGIVNIRMTGRMKALEQLAKITRLYEDTVLIKSESPMTEEEKANKLAALLKKAKERAETPIEVTTTVDVTPTPEDKDTTK